MTSNYVRPMLAFARRFTLPFWLGIFVATPLFAQKYVPRQIVFSGYSDVTQAELLAASGLNARIPIGQPEMQAAAQRLSDTGLFSDVRFSFDGAELRYDLKPAGGALPAIYGNFPWWQSKELNAVVATKVPLFHGSVIPESGLQNDVTAALAALVRERGVPATVSAAPRNDESGKAVGVEFHIDSPAVQIGEVKVAGASAAWVAPLAEIEKAAAGQDFGEGIESTLQQAVRAIYHRKGFLDESLSQFAFGQPQFLNGKVLVPISATIQEGQQYYLKALNLSGDILMTPEEFAKHARLHAGDVVNEDLLRQTLAQVAQPYKAKGYLRATIDATPVFDHWQHTVDYSVTVKPGPVFHMGKLTLVNLDTERQALVMKYWTLKEGDAYDATYAPTFRNRNKNNLHELDGWSANYKQYENEETHIVDLAITFTPGGPLN